MGALTAVPFLLASVMAAAAAESHRPAVLVFHVDAGPGASPQAGQDLGDAVLQVTRGSEAFGRVISLQELASVVPPDEMKRMGSCTDVCGGELADSTGADWVITAEVTRNGQASTLVLRLFLARGGSAFVARAPLGRAAGAALAGPVRSALADVLGQAKLTGVSARPASGPTPPARPR
ncbi:MAG: hypothetical protein HY904_10595 [Deltaproteobacteria bacterium]|nr:hypothetical protein [Deltaproteobacteria bacterium]